MSIPIEKCLACNRDLPSTRFREYKFLCMRCGHIASLPNIPVSREEKQGVAIALAKEDYRVPTWLWLYLDDNAGEEIAKYKVTKKREAKERRDLEDKYIFDTDLFEPRE